MLERDGFSSHGAGLFVAVALLFAGLSASAEKGVEPIRISGSVEAGGREVIGRDASAKLNQYRDLHQGLFGSADILFEDREGHSFLRFGGYDLGEDDGEYFLEAGQWGLWVW